MSFYGYILLFSFVGPLLLSFDRKVAFYRHIKKLILPLILVSGGFLVWDHWFTSMEVWGFNTNYVCGLYLGKLPLEEVLFFFVVPYNCLFIYKVIEAYFQPKENLNFNKVFMVVFIALGLVLIAKNPSGWYTQTAVMLGIFLCVGLWYFSPHWLSLFLWTFLCCLIPFFIVNGLLTGMATQHPVVWYNPSAFSNWRILTIPVEDLFYNFDLLLGFVVFFNLKTQKSALI